MRKINEYKKQMSNGKVAVYQLEPFGIDDINEMLSTLGDNGINIRTSAIYNNDDGMDHLYQFFNNGEDLKYYCRRSLQAEERCIDEMTVDCLLQGHNFGLTMNFPDDTISTYRHINDNINLEPLLSEMETRIINSQKKTNGNTK